MFFRTQLLVSTLLAVSSVLGAPSEGRNVADPCKGFGNRAYSTLDNFQIAAYKPNSETEAYALVQKQGPDSSPYSGTLTVGTWDDDTTGLHHMKNGGISGSSGPQSVVATSVRDNHAPKFLVDGKSPATPAHVWCAVKNDDVTGDALGYDFLAANNRYDLWSLCHDIRTSAVRVAFNVDKTRSNEDLDVKSCFPVYLRIISTY